MEAYDDIAPSRLARYRLSEAALDLTNCSDGLNKA